MFDYDSNDEDQHDEDEDEEKQDEVTVAQDQVYLFISIDLQHSFLSIRFYKFWLQLKKTSIRVLQHQRQLWSRKQKVRLVKRVEINLC